VLSVVAYFTELVDKLNCIEAPLGYNFFEHPIRYARSVLKRREAFRILESISDDLLQELYDDAKEAAKLTYTWEFVSYAKRLSANTPIYDDDIGYSIAQLEDYLQSFRAVKMKYVRHYHSAEWSHIE